jgi:alpha-tubulin suppressor-like RCC1 family protein
MSNVPSPCTLPRTAWALLLPGLACLFPAGCALDLRGTWSPDGLSDTRPDETDPAEAEDETCPPGETPCFGHCVDLLTDAVHCGACGNTCATALNADPLCDGGLCRLQCKEGWADIDGDPGCEARCTFVSPDETCDGRDENCNGRVDETYPCEQGSPVSCVTVCGSRGTGTCGVDCQLPGPEACPLPEERCNGADDDCDGDCDEGFECCAGLEERCTTLSGVPGTVICGSLCTLEGGGCAGRWQQIAAGGAFTCAIAYDRSLWCWGANASGQLGNGSYVSSTVPVRVGPDTDWVRVAAGGGHACAVKTDESLWCWGSNSNGQIGDGTYGTHLEPWRVGTSNDWESPALGASHSCAIRLDDTLWCWGQNDDGRLGDGTTMTRLEPVPVTSIGGVVEAACGACHTCAVTSEGGLFCWGRNFEWQLGEGPAGGSLVPQSVEPVSGTWVSVTAGHVHTCAVSIEGSLYCWGSNSEGQLGDGTSVEKNHPTLIGASGTWRLAAAGDYHTCAAKTSGQLWCWGSNDDGQVGDGTTENRASPAGPVGSTSDWSDLSLGAGHSCGTSDLRALFCWGTNWAGQLGDGTTDTRTTPVLIGL